MYIRLTTTFLAAILLLNMNATAQDKDNDKPKHTKTLSVGSNGITVEKDEVKTKESKITLKFGAVDLGLNSLQDKTDYNSAAAKAFLNVPDKFRNESLFDLRTGKSWNVNVWPVLLGWTPLCNDKQQIVIGTGVGIQMYNFRFNKNITYINEVTPEVYIDTVRSFTKNKLTVSYLSIPLMLNFKTKAGSKTWIVYGVGVTGGYRIASRNKQVTLEDGKQKNNNKYNLNDFNACVTAEFGLDDYFRLFASYQLTPLHENALVQHPLSIGIRFGGI